MRAFRLDETARLDCRLLRDGACTLICDLELFDRRQRELEALGYRVHVLDASDADALVAGFATALRFEHNYGYTPTKLNMDALTDAFRDLSFDDAEGHVLALRRFDLAVVRNADRAKLLVEVIEKASRDWLVFGGRLIALLQSQDPKLAVARLDEEELDAVQRRVSDAAEVSAS
jgi:hypothetical protein